MTTDSGVTITRDQWGIGHAETTDADQAFWAQGWMAASDRMWQMEWDRRRALGRWAEVAGPPAVAEDTFFRRLGLAAGAKRQWARLDERTRTMTEAYSRGVNAWLEGGGGEQPGRSDWPSDLAAHPEPPAAWEPWHCLAVYQVRHLFMGSFHRKLWRAAVLANAGPEAVMALMGDPDTQAATVSEAAGAAGQAAGGDGATATHRGGPTAAPGLLADAERVLAQAGPLLAGVPDTDGGSNNWAVAGSRTASGKPLLAGDPHRTIEFPNVYYQCHLRCPEFDVIGLAFPGVPGFPHFGHNAEVAWCITHGMADDTDVFVEQGPIEITSIETIEVLGAEPIQVPCARTERGPVVLGDPTGAAPMLSMMWTAFHGDDTTFECLRPMLESGSVPELEAAVSRWVVPVNNLLSADRVGNISFRIRGRVIERPVANRWTPVPGDEAHGWAGREPVPFDELPRLNNPDRGFLVTANNRIADNGPYISVDFARSDRHNRIVELLTELEQATVPDMLDIHADTQSLAAPALVERLLKARPATEAGRRAQAVLAAWDGDVAATAIAPTIYSTVRRLWSTEVMRRFGLVEVSFGEPGWPSSAMASRSLFEGATRMLIGDGWRHLPGLVDDHDLAVLLGTVTDGAAGELAERFGPDPAEWTWDRAHLMVSPHPLATARPELGHLHPPVDAVAGDGDTVRASSVSPGTGERAVGSAVARYVFDLDDWERSGWVVPHGVSGVRGSGHDLDQRAAWLGCELVPMAYSAAAIAAVAASVQVLRVVDDDASLGGPG